jgi:hypothetical protein
MKKNAICSLFCLFCLIGLLDGCTSLSASHLEAKDLRQRCLDSPVLITDLTQPENDRKFQLPDGRLYYKAFI